jgi:Family of unknown function (DUF6152)
MRQTSLAAAVLALLLFPAALFAHHGTAGAYDLTKVVKITGTVKEFRWRNPHSALFVVAADAAGHEVTYSMETGSPSTLVRAGLTRDSFKPGDKVTVDMNPAFEGLTSGLLIERNGFTVNGQAVKPVRTGEP